MSGLHMGRLWSGHEIEDDCPCAQEACGLVSVPDPSCPQHGLLRMKTMRQMHLAENCPAGSATPEQRQQ